MVKIFSRIPKFMETVKKNSRILNLAMQIVKSFFQVPKFTKTSRIFRRILKFMETVKISSWKKRNVSNHRHPLNKQWHQDIFSRALYKWLLLLIKSRKKWVNWFPFTKILLLKEPVHPISLFYYYLFQKLLQYPLFWKEIQLSLYIFWNSNH